MPILQGAFEPLLNLIRYIWNLIGFGSFSRRAISDPLNEVLKFIDDYEQKYGSQHPKFYRGTYEQALNEAKHDLKFLLVYLHSDHHQDTDDFCLNVLNNIHVINYIERNNILFWACSILTTEGYRVSEYLKERVYPFVGLIALRDNRMLVVKKFEGKNTVERLLSQLEKSIDDNEHHLVTARIDRQERSMSQLLREEQDRAYNESLQADKEKERKRKEAAKLKKEAEDDLKKKEIDEKCLREKLIQLKTDLINEIPEEPELGKPNTIRISIKLPSGTRLERRFDKTKSIKYLYFFVFCNDKSPLFFEITTNFPRRVLPGKPPSVEDPYCSWSTKLNGDESESTFEKLGIKSEMLFVNDLEA